jgi:uncharacterized protein (DUF433 family)
VLSVFAKPVCFDYNADSERRQPNNPAAESGIKKMNTNRDLAEPPPTEAELDVWEERARANGVWAGEDVLRLIAEVRRLRQAQRWTGDPLQVVRDPERCGGAPTLAGTRTAVHHVVSYFKLHHGDLDEIHRELPHLSTAQIQTALAYYDKYQAEIEEILRQHRDFVAGLPVAPVRR